ncbi:hypothetical protein [Helicobacter sp.]|uniref:hypothetical protein n=1 Tax=Helicobacter sp. TaxID=218 RepID=UPI0019A83012|nr:hypothetical protein [Helicobacter sp.]MBD5165434.1 hypothetical protein [Helicobacter sp.]
MVSKIGEHKIAQYEKVCKLLGFEIPSKVILDYQSNNECALGLLVEYMNKILKEQIPKVEFFGKILRISFEQYQRGLTLLLAHFQDYLLEESLSSLQDSLEIHLNNTYAMIAKFENCIKEYNIGITMIGYTKDNKHIGEIDKFLPHSLVYCCDSEMAYELTKERIGKNYAFISHSMYYVIFPKMKVLLSINTPLPLVKLESVKPTIVHLGHNFNESLQYTLHRTGAKYIFESLNRERIQRCHYVIAHTVNDFRLLEQICEYFHLPKEKIIKGGNPSLDWVLQKINGKKSQNYYLLFAPSYLENFMCDEFIQSINELLNNGIKIVFRLHPALRKKQKAEYARIIAQWCKNKNFIFDETPSFLNEYILNSFVLLTDESSMGVSYPFWSLKPSIIYMPNKRKYGARINDIHLYHKECNIILKDLKNLKKVVMDIRDSKIQQAFEIEINQFRDKQAYNLYHSSKFLSEFIMDIYRRK